MYPCALAVTVGGKQVFTSDELVIDGEDNRRAAANLFGRGLHVELEELPATRLLARLS